MKQFQNNFSKAGEWNNDNQPNNPPPEEYPKPSPIKPRTKSANLEGGTQPENKNPQDYRPKPTLKHQKKKVYTPLMIGIAATFVAVVGVGLLATNSFMGNKSASLVTQERVDNQPVKPTPSHLIAQAEEAIIQYQENKEPSALRSPLNELQILKNKQGVRLDNEGEQRLSRLKHKYAIEVLASSGQKAEAAKMLKEVSTNYSEYKDVEKWIAKLKK
jgi:hypothetical protein